MTYSVFEESARDYTDRIREAERDAAAHEPLLPRPGSREDAYERGYNPRDWSDQ